MPCGGCARRKAVARTAARTAAQTKDDYDLMGGYANLNDQQIKARLEMYKRRFCKSCGERYTCDFVRYTECRKLK